MVVFHTHNLVAGRASPVLLVLVLFLAQRNTTRVALASSLLPIDTIGFRYVSGSCH